MAAMVLKILLVDLVMNYDLKPTDDPPRTREINNIIFTDPGARIMLRKRMD